MIADFVMEKMSAYVVGGMKPATAARFAMGELSAIYRGSHYSRDAAGTMRPTPPPENITLDDAGAKCKAAIKEILNNGTQGKAPENPPVTQEKSGFEKMAEYAIGTA